MSRIPADMAGTSEYLGSLTDEDLIKQVQQAVPGAFDYPPVEELIRRYKNKIEVCEGRLKRQVQLASQVVELSEKVRKAQEILRKFDFLNSSET